MAVKWKRASAELCRLLRAEALWVTWSAQQQVVLQAGSEIAVGAHHTPPDNMGDPVTSSAEEQDEIAEMLKGIKRDGGQLSLAYRPFGKIPGGFVHPPAIPLDSSQDDAHIA